MRPSPELAAVVDRYVTAFLTRDTDTIRGLISTTDGVVIIGSDEREWLIGTLAVEVVMAQVREMPPFEWAIRNLVAYEEGQIGWVAADTEVEIEGLPMHRFRVTAVFRLEQGSWKVVQWHSSVPVDQSETVGFELTVSLEQVLASLDADTADRLRTSLNTSTVTLMFTDIEDSTAMMDSFGDARWAELMQAHLDDLSVAARADGGDVVKALGDGAMLAFDSARAAVRSAMAIQRKAAGMEFRLPVRIGIHTGDVMKADRDYFGQMVNKAARIASAAAGGEVMVSEVVQALVGPDDRFGDPMQVELKGLPGVHMIVPVRWDDGN